MTTHRYTPPAIVSPPRPARNSPPAASEEATVGDIFYCDFNAGNVCGAYVEDGAGDVPEDKIEIIAGAAHSGAYGCRIASSVDHAGLYLSDIGAPALFSASMRVKIIDTNTAGATCYFSANNNCAAIERNGAQWRAKFGRRSDEIGAYTNFSMPLNQWCQVELAYDKNAGVGIVAINGAVVVNWQDPTSGDPLNITDFRAEINGYTSAGEMYIDDLSIARAKQTY